MNGAAESFRSAIEQAGLTPPPEVHADGKLHRFASNGDPDDDAGWYALFADGVPAGAFGDWRTGLKQNWCAKPDRDMTDRELRASLKRMQTIQHEREQADQLRQQEAAREARRIWDAADPAPMDHPYLRKKRIAPHGLRLYRGTLVLKGHSLDEALLLPVHDATGIVWSLEFILADGTKRFLPGGRKRGGFYLIGEMGKTLAIAEGFATAASLHQATGYPVAVAFDAGNLTPVAHALRAQHPDVRLVICGDHDQSGVGQTKAKEAAEAVGGLLAIPETEGDDWNDVHVRDGLEEVKMAIETALSTSTETDPLPPVADPEGLASALLEFKELISLTLPDRKRYLPWLPEGGNVMVYGPRGIGKTFFELGIAASLSTGTPFLKWPSTEPVGVLYVDGEMQLDELRERMTNLLPAPPNAALQFLSSEMVYSKLRRDLVLSSESVRDEILTILDSHPEIRVLIFDNVSCLFAGIDEDKKRDWEPIAAWLIRLRHRGLATILVHHAGKGGQQRGTSGREDALDTVIHLDRPSAYEVSEGCHFEVKFTKCRSVKGEEVAPLDVRLIEHGGRLVWAYTALERSKEDQVKELLAEGLQNNAEIAEALNLTRSYVWKLRRKIEKGGGE